MTTKNKPAPRSRAEELWLRRRAQRAITVGEHAIEMRAILEALNGVLIREYFAFIEDEQTAEDAWHNCVDVIDALTGVITRLIFDMSSSFEEAQDSEILALAMTNRNACPAHRVSALALPDLPEENEIPITIDSSEPKTDKAS